MSLLSKTRLINYLHQSDDVFYILQGFGGIYNHSNSPNAELSVSSKSPHIFHVRALKPILRGEEIFLYYGDNWQKEHGARTINPKEKLPLIQALLKQPVVKLLLVMTFIAILLKL